jgi:hypothetical protein
MRLSVEKMLIMFVLLLGNIFFSLAAGVSSMNTSSQLLAGAGQVDITPAVDIQLAGDSSRRRPVESVIDPLYARALVLRQGPTTVCLVSTDLCYFKRRLTAPLRKQIADLLGTEPGAILLHATQNHSGPSFGSYAIQAYPVPDEAWWLRSGGDERYNPVVSQGIIKAVSQAVAALEPVTIRAARGVDGRLAFNRRFIRRDRTSVIQFPSNCDPVILKPEGPADPEIDLVVFYSVDTGTNSRPVAALLNHTCHPAHGLSTCKVSADWPGLWAEETRRLLGSNCVALPFNGFCGNIEPINRLDPGGKKDLGRMVQWLMETTRRIQSKLASVTSVPLRYTSCVIPVKWRPIPADKLEKARALIKEHPQPLWKEQAKKVISGDWMLALEHLDMELLHTAQASYPYEIQAVRMGDVALVGWPGEPFVEAQLSLKFQSPAPFLLTANECNDEAGYQPTRDAFERGGYETELSNWSALDMDTLEIATQETRRILKELFP